MKNKIKNNFSQMLPIEIVNQIVMMSRPKYPFLRQLEIKVNFMKAKKLYTDTDDIIDKFHELKGGEEKGWW